MPRGAGASAPSPETLRGAALRKKASEFRVAMFRVLGGTHWLKFVLALGDVPAEAVEATNEVIDLRRHERRHEHAQRTPSGWDEPWAASRAERSRLPPRAPEDRVYLARQDLRKRWNDLLWHEREHERKQPQRPFPPWLLDLRHDLEEPLGADNGPI